MRDRSTFDTFEQRLAGELERFVADANDPKPAADIAAAAMRPRGVAARARNAPTSRRLLMLGIAAVLLVPAVYLGVGGVRRTPEIPAPSAVPRVLAPTPSDAAAPTPSAAAADPMRPQVAIFLRRVSDPVPGVSVFAVGADGAETLVRHIPDTVDQGAWADWGAVSTTGWLALSSGGRWSMSLVDLRDELGQPWVVADADLGGIGPRWGPTGLVAADAGGNGARVVIADPETHALRTIQMPHGLVGGGPSIVWAGDGSGIVTGGEGRPEVIPIDGGPPRPVGGVFDPRGAYGPALAELRICTPDAGCGGTADGRVERLERDGSTRTVWQPGPDRALAAAFGRDADEYWLSTSRANGSQVGLVRVAGGDVTDVTSISRGGSWSYVGAPVEAPDHAFAVLWIDNSAKAASAVVPLDGGTATFRTGAFAGFVNRDALASSLAAHSPTPGQAIPVTGETYRLPSVDALIASERQSNTWRRVLATGSHDATPGDTGMHDVTVPRHPGGGDLFLDCYGPSSATVTVGGATQTSPCLSAGAYVMEVDSTSPIVVTATGDTSWRVVLYTSTP